MPPMKKEIAATKGEGHSVQRQLALYSYLVIICQFSQINIKAASPEMHYSMQNAHMGLQV